MHTFRPLSEKIRRLLLAKLPFRHRQPMPRRLPREEQLVFPWDLKR